MEEKSIKSSRDHLEETVDTGLNEFDSVNHEILWNPTSQIGKFIDFTSHRYFYPKNDRVSMKNEVLKTDKNNNFSPNSVNGGRSFLSKTNYEFF